MRPQLPVFFQRLNRHLLESFPVLWILRLHYVLAVWLLGLALLVGFALALPIRISTVLPFERPYWLILGAIGLLSPPWVYSQAQASSALRHDPRPQTGVFLLAAYLGISALFLLWPAAFYRVFEARIAGSVTADDAALVRLASAGELSGPEIETLFPRFEKRHTEADPLTPGIRGDTLDFQNDNSRFLSLLVALRHPTPERELFLRGQRTSRVFYDWRWALALILAVLWSRIVQGARREDLLPLSVVLGLASLIATGASAISFLAPVALAIGAFATFWGIGTGRSANILLTLGTTLFYLVLPSSVLCAQSARLLGDLPPATCLALGLVLHFAFAPFVERRLFSLAAAPR